MSQELRFHQIYQSITARPYQSDTGYVEFEPSADLKPYIRCFWANTVPSKKEARQENKLIIPDTCMDIIFEINETDNQINSRFIGINDTSFYSGKYGGNGKIISTFGIRFYAWTAILFSQESMMGVKNQKFDIGYHFERLKKQIQPRLFDAVTNYERIAIAEKILREELKKEQMHPIMLDALHQMLIHQGRLDVFSLAKEVYVSTRQLERLYQFHIGMSPKQLSSLIRYQYLWNEIAFRTNFQILDAVEKYGYTDQSHLLKEFKRYHTMLPNQAKEYANHPVAFLL